MRRIVSRYCYRTGFVLRRADRMAGELNSFLLLAAIALALLDLAGTVEKVVAALPRG